MHKQLLALSLVAAAFAQDLSGLPSCAQPIVLSQIGATTCGTDITCVCRNNSFIGSLRNLIVAQCGESDASAANAFYKTTCANNGVNIDASAAPSTTSGSAGVTVTSTTILESNTMAANNMTGSSSVTGNPSMTATMIPSLSAQGSCAVTTTTVCHSATVAPTTTGAHPSAWTGAANIANVNGALAGLAVMAALL